MPPADIPSRSFYLPKGLPRLRGSRCSGIGDSNEAQQNVIVHSDESGVFIQGNQIDTVENECVQDGVALNFPVSALQHDAALGLAQRVLASRQVRCDARVAVQFLRVVSVMVGIFSSAWSWLAPSA